MMLLHIGLVVFMLVWVWTICTESNGRGDVIECLIMKGLLLYFGGENGEIFELPAHIDNQYRCFNFKSTIRSYCFNPKWTIDSHYFGSKETTSPY